MDDGGGRMTRVAAIDIGSNAVRLVVAETLRRGGFRIVGDSRAQTRLGVSAADDGRISGAAADATIAALGRMMAEAAGLEAGVPRAVATAAVRHAPNGRDLVERALRELGLDVEVVSAEEEARLVFLSAAHDFDLGRHAAVFDLGGGSVELVRATGDKVECVRSLPLGAVVLTQRFVREDPPGAAAAEELRAHVRGEIATGLADALTPPRATVFGSGGSVTALGAMAAKSRGLRRRDAHGLTVLRGEVTRLLERLEPATALEREAIPGMPPHRVDIILAGVLVVDELMAALRAHALRVNTRGLREGIVIDMLGEGLRRPRRGGASPVAEVQ